MQLQNTFDKNKIEADLKKKEQEQKSTKSIILGALRKISGGSRKNSKVILLYSDTKYLIDIPKKGTEIGVTNKRGAFKLSWSTCGLVRTETEDDSDVTVFSAPPTPPSTPAVQERKRTPVNPNLIIVLTICTFIHRCLQILHY